MLFETLYRWEVELSFCVFLISVYFEQGYTNERSKMVPIQILSFQPAINPLNAQRVYWMQMQEQGFDMVTNRAKKDLNDFFGRAPRSLVWKALGRMLAQLRQTFGSRRGVVAIP